MFMVGIESYGRTDALGGGGKKAERDGKAALLVAAFAWKEGELLPVLPSSCSIASGVTGVTAAAVA